jgi:hypothetical protein
MFNFRLSLLQHRAFAIGIRQLRRHIASTRRISVSKVANHFGLVSTNTDETIRNQAQAFNDRGNTREIPRRRYRPLTFFATLVAGTIL